jgi:hypothetical protein
MRARRGQLLRGYGWLGQKGVTFWDEGKATTEERDLGFGFPSAAVEQAQDARATLPDEASLMQLAALWSIDPTSLDEHFKEPLLGLLGNAPLGERI